MKRILIGGLLSLLYMPAQAQWSGHLAIENQHFFHAGAYPGQRNNYPSLSFEPEYYRELSGPDLSLTFKGFARADEHDRERTHADVRELYLFAAGGDWEWRFGIDKVYWGVTESRHLVDTINQTDLVENIDGEDKFGQPMIAANVSQGENYFEFYVLPGFRERSFPGTHGRLRGPLVVDSDHPAYESEDAAQHVDYALRLSRSILDYWDLGIHYFNGTSRDPVLEARGSSGSKRLVPVYYLMQQIGLDLQGTLDAWLLKLEMIYRATEPKDFLALVGGFEYTLPALTDAGLELGVLAEYLYDDRATPINFQNDLFLGTRWAFNDTQSSEILAGALIDLDYGSTTLRVEANRRLGARWKLTIEGQSFSHINARDPIDALRNDDFLTLALALYF